MLRPYSACDCWMLIYGTALNIIMASSFGGKKQGFHSFLFFSFLFEMEVIVLYLRDSIHIRLGCILKKKKVRLRKCEQTHHDLVPISRIFIIYKKKKALEIT